MSDPLKETRSLRYSEWLQQAHQKYQAGELNQAHHICHQLLQTQPQDPRVQLLLGWIDFAREDYSAATTHFLALKHSPVPPAEYYPYWGPALQMLKRHREAQEIYRHLHKIDPEEAGHLYNLGTALQATETYAEAESAFRAALKLKPIYPKAQNNLGSCLLAQERLAEAAESFRKTVDMAPAYRMAWINLARTCQRLGDPGEASAAYLHALKLGEDAESHFQLGRVYQQMGHLDLALESFRSALKLEPKSAESWRNLAVSQQGLGQWQASLDSLKQALNCEPEHAASLWDLGNAHKELGETDAAQACFAALATRQPSFANRIRQATFLPPLYRSLEELQAYRQRFATGVAELRQNPEIIADPLSEIGQTNFYLAYQGGNDRPLQEQVAQLYRKSLPEVVWPQSARPQDSRIRVGFLSAFLYNHTITHYYAQHIQSLDPEIFHTELFLAPGCPEDQVTWQLRQHSQRTHRLPRDLKAAARLLAERHLDVLVYLDIGMEPFSYFLAFTRVAPVQCVLPGHPVTTGIPTLDYYLSNTWMERPDAAADYSESLVPLASLPVWYPKPALPEVLLNKTELGLDPQRNLYLCPMTLFKLHPEMDAAFAQILETDPQAEIALFRFKQSHMHQILAARFAQTLGAAAQRIRFLPWSDSQTFFSLLHSAEVLLDSFHFGGGSTHFLCFAVGTPMVTWPSAYLRGRSGAGMYHRMGLSEGIADSPTEYAHKAVALATSKARRQALKSQILSHNEVLFANPEGPEAFAQWLQTVGAQITS